MTMTMGEGTDEALIHVAQNMLRNQGGNRSERVCYYRTPQKTTTGSPHAQAGWIGWDQTQESIQLRKVMRGYLPLQQYGLIDAEHEPYAANFERYGPWGQILCDPEGVKELPASQIIAYFWYDEGVLRDSLRGNIPPTLRVKDGMVLWPQLKGMNLRVYVCPECTNKRYNEPIHLARHLRNWHDYDRQDIIAFGREQGVDFSTEFVGGGIKHHYAFDDDEDGYEGAVKEEDDDGFVMEAVAAPRRTPRKATKRKATAKRTRKQLRIVDPVEPGGEE